MIDMKRELDLMCRQVADQLSEGVRRLSLCLFVSEDFRERLVKYHEKRPDMVRAAGLYEFFMGIRMVVVEDLEGWRIDHEFASFFEHHAAAPSIRWHAECRDPVTIIARSPRDPSKFSNEIGARSGI